MKKSRFDTLVNNILLQEGTHSKEQRYGNVSFDLSKIVDLIGDQSSDYYKQSVLPFIKNWSNKSYLGNLSPEDVNSLFRLTVSKFENLLNDDVQTIPYVELSSIIDDIYRGRFKGHKDGMSTLARRWSGIVKNFFEKMKESHTQSSNNEEGSPEAFDDDSLEGSEKTETSQKTGSSIEDAVLSMVQGAESVSRAEVVQYLVRKMGREPEIAEQIISSLLSKGELVENEIGHLEINKESGVLEPFAEVEKDEFDDEDETPSRGFDIEEEDPEIAERISSMRDSDEDFYSSSKY
jgi:hypothetical protein